MCVRTCMLVYCSVMCVCVCVCALAITMHVCVGDTSSSPVVCLETMPKHEPATAHNIPEILVIIVYYK